MRSLQMYKNSSNAPVNPCAATSLSKKCFCFLFLSLVNKNSNIFTVSTLVTVCDFLIIVR